MAGQQASACEQWQGSNWCPDAPDILNRLTKASIESCEVLPTGSNYVFAVRLASADYGIGIGIYKPLRGEAPLWDYPEGNLFQREAATYVVCRALDWNFVPPTVIREGPHGVGTVQLYIEHDPRDTFFSLREARKDDLQRMAVFDVIVNNGDRKGGHCLLGLDGRIWGIDHGLTFHTENKLRTVIWDFAGEAMPDRLVEGLRRLVGQLERGCALIDELGPLLSRGELAAFRRRVAAVIAQPIYPTAGYRRSVPWPPV